MRRPGNPIDFRHHLAGPTSGGDLGETARTVADLIKQAGTILAPQPTVGSAPIVAIHGAAYRPQNRTFQRDGLKTLKFLPTGTGLSAACFRGSGLDSWSGARTRPSVS